MSIEIPKLVPGDAVFCARPSVEWLYDAIMATASAAALQPEDGVRDALTDHLITLVQQCRKLFVSAMPLPHLRAVEEKPWHPDNSGEFVGSGERLHHEILETAALSNQQLDEGMRAALAANLSDLVNRYRVTYGELPAEPPVCLCAEEVPWYPDNSGEWVEVPDACNYVPLELPESTRVYVLCKCERTERRWLPFSAPAWDLYWSLPCTDPVRIVAYKVCTP